MLPKILLNSRVSGNKYLRGNVLTGQKGHSKKVFLFGCLGFSFGVSFFGVFFFFFLTAWYKKKKEKDKVKLLFPSSW